MSQDPSVCSGCGARVQPDQNFCGNCGRDLRGAGVQHSISPASYTPPHLAQRILAQRHLLVGERKRVTVLFADIVDSTASIENVDPEEAARWLTRALGGMMDAIHRYEGTVNTLRGDGLIALFGAPIAHEDHAVRAALAALSIPDAVATTSAGTARTRVGLHSGEVLVREVGNDLSVEYQALGPTVHLAARMEAMAAPGTSCATNEIRRLIDGRIETRSLGLRQIKGILDPVEVFELVRPLEATAWEARASRGLTAFAGRARELDRLDDLLRKAGDGGGRGAMIVGEAGIGKSRLVHEFLSGVSPENFTILRAEASALEINTAYHAVRGLVYSWLGSPGSGESHQVCAALCESDPVMKPLLAPLCELLNVPVEDESWNALDPPVRRRAMRQAMCTLIERLAGSNPQVVVVEDLHWIDGETQSVLDSLVDLVRDLPVLMLCTHRPEYENKWRGLTHVCTITLDPLSRNSALSLLDDLIGTDASVTDIKTRVAERAQGTPLFLEETVRTLVESGALDGTRGGYTSRQRDLNLDVPDSVQAILAARVDRLDPADKNVLQIAALAGDEVRPDMLARLMERPVDETEAVLSRLESRAFLRLIRLDPSPEFRFGHALMRDVAYESLPRASRRSMHTRMLEVLAGPGQERSIERLAHHASRAELWDEAARFSLDAADQSIRRSAFREASAFLRESMRCLAMLPQERAVVEKAIDARIALRVAETGARGGLVRIRRDLETAAEMAAAIGDERRQAMVAVQLGYAANMLGYMDEAREQARAVAEVAQRIDDVYYTAESRILSAQCCSYSGKPAQINALLLPCMDYLTKEIRHETMGQTMIRSVTACSHLAVGEAFLERFESSARWEREGHAIAGEANRPFDLMYMHFISGVCLDLKGEYQAAVRAHDRSAEIAEDNDVWFMKTLAQPWRGHALLKAGAAGRALEVLHAAESYARYAEVPFIEIWCRVMAAMIYREQGDFEAARSEAEAAIEFGRSFDVPLLIYFGYAAAGQHEEAQQLARQQGYTAWS